MDAPDYPDPAETAAAQGDINAETAITQYGLNATNQYTPYGALTYEQVGTWEDGTPHYAATQTLTPDQKAILDNTEQLGISLTGLGVDQIDELSSLLGNQYQLPGGSVEQYSPTASDFSYSNAVPQLNIDTKATQDLLTKLGMERLDPELSKARVSTEQDLFNRGVRPGTEAYNNAMTLQGQQENDARNSLILSGWDTAFSNQLDEYAAQLAGQGQGFEQALAGYNANVNADSLAYSNYLSGRDQANEEYTANYMTPINTILALASGGQVTNPTFTSTPGTQLPAVDYTGLVQDQYESELASYQSGMSGLFGLGSALIGAIPFSDRRLKSGIKRVGTLFNGMSVYLYEINGVWQIGLMADEVKDVVPEAIVVDPETGFDRVNYAVAVH